MKGIKEHSFIITALLFIILALLSNAYGAQEKVTSVSGIVVCKGKPVSGAEVYIIQSDGVRGDCRKSEVAAKTGEDGKFAVKNLAPGSLVTVEIQSDGYAKGSWNMVKTGQQGIVFQLVPEGRIAGRITYSDTGKPAENVSVMAFNQKYPSRTGIIVKTDKNGRYSIYNLIPGMYYVYVSTSSDEAFTKKRKYSRYVGSLEKTPEWIALTRENVEVMENETTENVDFRLIRGGIISGRVTFENTGEPISGLCVSVFNPGLTRVGAITDNGGYYQIRSIPGTYYVRPEPQLKYVDPSIRRIKVEVIEDKTVSDIDFTYSKDIEVTVRVLSPEGEPVAGALLNGLEKTGEDGKIILFVSKTQKRLVLMAEHKGLHLRGKAAIMVEPGIELTIPLERYETTSVEGRVVDENGNPLSSITIRSHVMSKLTRTFFVTNAALTDGNGRFCVDGLNIDDTVSLEIQADGYKFTKIQIPLLSKEMSPLEDIVLSRADRWIEGTVTFSDGTPVIGARVHIFDSPSGSKLTFTNSKGFYHLDSLVPEVEKMLDINPPNDLDSYRFNDIATNEIHNFTLQIADRFLEGMVIYNDGSPVKGAHVMSLDRGNRNILGNPGVLTDEKGNFRLEELMFEREKIRVSLKDFQKVFENIETNRDSVIFVIDINKTTEEQ